MPMLRAHLETKLPGSRDRKVATLEAMTHKAAGHRTSLATSVRRPVTVGFLVGFLVTVPATFLTLMFNWAERVSDFVVPSTFLLHPLSSYMVDWHGALNMGLASLVNGLVYGIAATAVATLVWCVRRR